MKYNLKKPKKAMFLMAAMLVCTSQAKKENNNSNDNFLFIIDPLRLSKKNVFERT